MAWAGLVSELSSLGGVSGPGEAYARGVMITQGVREGISANSIITGMQQVGISVRREHALALIRNEAARQLAGTTSAQLDLNQPISELLAAEPPAGFTGNYIHQVAITYRTRDAEGNYMLNTITRGIKSPTVLTAGEAVQSALDIVSQQPIAPEEYPGLDVSSLMAASLTGAWYDTRSSSLPTYGGGGGGAV